MNAYQLRTEKRNITIDDRRTSLQLECYIWANFESILDLTGLSLETAISAIDKRRHNAALAQTVRLFCMTNLRIYLERLTGGLHNLKDSSYEKGDILAASESVPMDAISCYYQALDDLEKTSRK